MQSFYSSIAHQNEFILILLNSITEDGICTCGSSLCISKGKHPKGKWKNKDFVKDLNVSTDTIQYYIDLINKNQYNMAVQTGLNRPKTKRLVILDFDNMETEKDLIESLKKENTCEVLTGKGMHFYFILDSSVEIKSKIKPDMRGFDILSDGRYAVTVGSLHKTLNRYEWNGQEIRLMPDWIVSFLQSFENNKESFASKKQEIVYSQNSSPLNSSDKIIPKGKRNDTLFKELMQIAKFNLNSDLNFASAIKTYALKIRERMEDKSSFTDEELDKVVSSVVYYKKNDTINVKNNFSLEKASEIWTKKLINLGFVERNQDEFMKHKKFFNDLENFILKYGVVKKQLTEKYTGKTITEYIEYRSEVMKRLFFDVPLWNYVNVKYQNWATVFNGLGFQKQKYRGVKYFGKGNSKEEKVGFGIDFINSDELLFKLKLKFGNFLFKFLNKTLNRKNFIEKIHEETDLKILSFFNSKATDKILKLNNAKEYAFSMRLTAENCVPKLTGRKMQSENADKKGEQTPKLVKEIKVKNKIHKNHVSKYNSFGNIFYEEKNLEYSFDVSPEPNGLLQDRDKVVEILSSWKKGDIVGIGLHPYVFDSLDLEKDEITVFSSFTLEECVPKTIENRKKLSFSLINKYHTMDFLEILYRDGEIFSNDENEKYVTYQIFDHNDSVEEMKEEDKK